MVLIIHLLHQFLPMLLLGCLITSWSFCQYVCRFQWRKILVGRITKRCCRYLDYSLTPKVASSHQMWYYNALFTSNEFIYSLPLYIHLVLGDGATWCGPSWQVGLSLQTLATVRLFYLSRCTRYICPASRLITSEFTPTFTKNLMLSASLQSARLCRRQVAVKHPYTVVQCINTFWCLIQYLSILTSRRIISFHLFQSPQNSHQHLLRI
jgi:hypothetical protein